MLLPLLESRDGRPCFENGLRELAVVEMNIAQDGLLQLFTALETMVLQDIFDAAVEPFDHAVCLRSHRGCETVLDAEIGAKLIELMLPATTR
ncbi:hypothetical protein GCM10011363_44460 [Marivita lacus]|uniref:Uncharacterized protein n=1 Tax=Marivita lacus TaxID=1323742 RepID=A0ABQ1LGI5_9RHOB|nr:hypothetical protein GCM10011363_44460 [Marivita lacus]